MMFKFPLQRLLELKAKREQEMARQLAAAQHDASVHEGRRDAIAGLQADAANHIAATASASPSVGELLSMAFSLSQIGETLTAAAERAHEAQRVVDQRHGALSGAVQERQVLDRLRDKRLEQHRSDEAARDRTAMDAIALSRFTGARKESHDASNE